MTYFIWLVQKKSQIFSLWVVVVLRLTDTDTSYLRFSPRQHCVSIFVIILVEFTKSICKHIWHEKGEMSGEGTVCSEGFLEIHGSSRRSKMCFTHLINRTLWWIEHTFGNGFALQKWVLYSDSRLEVIRCKINVRLLLF